MKIKFMLLLLCSVVVLPLVGSEEGLRQRFTQESETARELRLAAEQESKAKVQEAEKDRLECPVCNDELTPQAIRYNKIAVCNNDHLTCGVCVAGMNPKICPICREGFLQSKVEGLIIRQTRELIMPAQGREGLSPAEEQEVVSYINYMRYDPDLGPPERVRNKMTQATVLGFLLGCFTSPYIQPYVENCWKFFGA